MENVGFSHVEKSINNLEEQIKNLFLSKRVVFSVEFVL
jgi:hypothetical protein